MKNNEKNERNWKIFLMSELARNSAVIFAATIIAGAFNYLYPVKGRVHGTGASRVWRVT